MTFPNFDAPGTERYPGGMLEQYLESPNIASLASLIGEEADKNRDACAELSLFFDPDQMEGVNLDILGRCVGESRGAMSDAAYRPIIKGALAKDYSGTPEQIIAYVKLVTGATKVTYIPEYPAGFWAIPADGDSTKLTQEVLDKISPAGVRGYLTCYLSLESPVSSPDEALLFEDGDWWLIEGPCIAPSSGWGFGWGEEWGG